jgi:poly(hydroxyalkanoate) depolymerase family esterase
MNYLGKIIKKSMKLNSLPGMKEAQKLMEKNLKSIMVNFEAEKPVAYNEKFLEKSFVSKYGNRDYKIYIPQKNATSPGLIVMLHGCTQNPDDFAIGTQMNILAEEENMIILYPKQSSSYNQSKCWNWFKDDGTSIGESKIISEMTKSVINEYDINPEDVYVAGMSAGGAMAVILATQYPDLYKAAGIHSGLPYKAATNINMALYSMKNGRDKSLDIKIKTPMIVFHGNKDETVAIKNAEQIISDIVFSYSEKVSTVVESTNTYTVTSYKEKEKLLAEYWVIKNKGHVWSGGDAKGSYTSATGPNASKEMMRFFKTKR